MDAARTSSLPFLAAILLISGSAGAVPFKDSCLNDQYFGACLDLYGAFGTVNNYNNDISGTAWTDEGWYIQPNSTYADSVRIVDNLTVEDDIYLGFDYHYNQSIYFTGAGGWKPYIRYDSEEDTLETDAMWEFLDTLNIKGTLYSPYLVGGLLWSNTDIYTQFAGGDLWLGGNSKSVAEMIINQDGSVDFKTPNFTIASTGEVGIGTDSPAEMLDVNGNVTADDFITKSTSYSGDALRLISGINSQDPGKEWDKVDHSSLGDLAVIKEVRVPVTKWVNESVCQDVVDAFGKPDTVCRYEDREEIIGYDTYHFEGVSIDRTLAVLIKAVQDLTKRVEELEKGVRP